MRMLDTILARRQLYWLKSVSGVQLDLKDRLENRMVSDESDLVGPDINSLIAKKTPTIVGANRRKLSILQLICVERSKYSSCVSG